MGLNDRIKQPTQCWDYHLTVWLQLQCRNSAQNTITCILPTDRSSRSCAEASKALRVGIDHTCKYQLTSLVHVYTCMYMHVQCCMHIYMYVCTCTCIRVYTLCTLYMTMYIVHKAWQMDRNSNSLMLSAHTMHIYKCTCIYIHVCNVHVLLMRANKLETAALQAPPWPCF